MNDEIRCPAPDTLITLLYDDEGDPGERAVLRAHVDACRACADALVVLDRTRDTLGAWPPSRLPLGFAVVSGQPPLWRRIAPWSGMAAAALLTLAGAAGLAQLDIRYDERGFALRTGWSRTGDASASPTTAPAAALAPAAAGAVATRDAAPSGDPRTAWVSRAADGEPPWRADFDLLATQLRSEFDARTLDAEDRARDAALRVVASSSAPVAGFDEERLMRRIAERIDQSEVRQQQNLALRIAELGREFQLRRQADLVQFERGLARIENQRQDLLRRVAVTQAPQP